MISKGVNLWARSGSEPYRQSVLFFHNITGDSDKMDITMYSLGKC